MGVLQKLSAVQLALYAPKNQYNSFGKYSYRSCEDILEALKEPLRANNASVIIADTIETVGDRVYVKATAAIYDNESGEHISTTAFAREDETKKGMDGAQITGAASSYARKYALNGLFLIDDNKDADTRPPESNEPQNNKPTIPPTAHKCADCGAEITKFKRKTGEMVSAEEAYKLTFEKYGVGLCLNCVKRRTTNAE